MPRFKVVSEYTPSGDQPQAIEKLAEGPEYRLSFALVEWLERLLAAAR